MSAPPGLLLAPVSVGEAVDKITILRIKQAEITAPAKRANVARELEVLEAAYAAHLAAPPMEVAALTEALLAVNGRLWRIEDAIRDCERQGDFGPEFVRLARSVYRENDERARLKREINLACGSALVEEKSYRDYRAGPEPTAE